MVAFPHCKINLGLQIVSKRDDGYHNINTCFYPIPWTDILEIIKADKFSFSNSGLEIPGNAEHNLCIKAFQLLQREYDLAPVQMHLHKVIPTGAGLGGGSSDAAFTLRMLNSIFNLDLSTQQLRSYASKIGSDCSFFVEDKPMLGSGRGEILTEVSVNLKGMYLVVLKPDIHVATAEAYAGVKPKVPQVTLPEIFSLPITKWKGMLVNDFEESVFQKYPAIALIKEKMYEQGAVYASMSGSGASVFGIFDTPIDLKSKFEGTYWTGALT